MPWLPELFSAPVLERVWEDARRRRMELVPFFTGVLTGETGALVESFAGEPELHHPVRGRIKGVPAFERFVEETRSWLTERGATAEDVGFVIVRGRVVKWLQGESAWEIVDQIALKYTGNPYPRGQERVVALIEPNRQHIGTG